MSARAQQYSLRRAELQLQCAAQRGQFAHSTAELAVGLHSLERALQVVRGLRVVPMLLTAVSAAGLVSKAGGVIRLLSRVWMIITTLRRLRRPPR